MVGKIYATFKRLFAQLNVIGLWLSAQTASNTTLQSMRYRRDTQLFQLQSWREPDNSGFTSPPRAGATIASPYCA
jgi:hypothetical protein